MKNQTVENVVFENYHWVLVRKGNGHHYLKAKLGGEIFKLAKPVFKTKAEVKKFIAIESLA